MRLNVRASGRAGRVLPVDSPRRAPGRLPLLAGVLLCVGGGGVLAVSAAASQPIAVGSIPAGDIGHGGGRPSLGAGPVLLDIPSLGIRAPIAAVHPVESGELGVPSSYSAVGWWGGRPGLDDATPVVLVGHVDDHRGPAVFYRLGRAQPGDEITVTAASGVTVRYVVDAVRQYNADRFPAERVYGATTRPTLRLITCGGFNWLLRHYADNVVVYAHQR